MVINHAVSNNHIFDFSRTQNTNRQISKGNTHNWLKAPGSGFQVDFNIYPHVFQTYKEWNDSFLCSPSIRSDVWTPEEQSGIERLDSSEDQINTGIGRLQARRRGRPYEYLPARPESSNQIDEGMEGLWLWGSRGSLPIICGFGRCRRQRLHCW